ncbi:MAG: aminotransferase class I/II-fold pyridoxal phosphate-dependent enzyme [Eubacterium sp.]|nr:aminotransferase class I/II-fold pyridoxal phosphate-dependent enzyme [Eubacterium sp.]
MIQHKDHFHGSDLEKIEQVYGIRREQITSFSANVNPLGISPRLRETLAQQIDAISSYPDRDYVALRRCIARYAGTDFENIIVGNGSTELISLFIQAEHPKKALIIGPTYSEYEREISLGGGSALYYPLREEDGFVLHTPEFISCLKDDIDLLVLCNPNNPTSACVTQKSMRMILDACLQHGIYVMVDETYVEFADQMEQITSIPLANYYNNLVILRGTSKFFAAPGLRLGYAVTGSRDLIKTINTRKNPWTINSLAAIAGEIMFADEAYIRETKALISAERKRLYRLFQERGDFKAYEPSGNFMLVKILKEGLTSGQLFDRAIRRGMMIRDCSTFPFLDDKYIRFCFMQPERNDALIQCMFEAGEQA